MTLSRVVHIGEVPSVLVVDGAGWRPQERNRVVRAGRVGPRNEIGTDPTTLERTGAGVEVGARNDIGTDPATRGNGPTRGSRTLGSQKHQERDTTRYEVSGPVTRTGEWKLTRGGGRGGNSLLPGAPTQAVRPERVSEGLDLPRPQVGSSGLGLKVSAGGTASEGWDCRPRCTHSAQRLLRVEPEGGARHDARS